MALQNSTRRTSPLDVTLEASNPAVLRGEPPPSPCAKVQLVEGRCPNLSTETESLHKVRLRAAALVLLAGSSLFLVWRLVWVGHVDLPTDILRFHERALFWFHIGHVASLAAAVALLYRPCRQFPRWHLTLCEVLVFGLTAVFFLYVQHYNTLYCSQVKDVVSNPAGMWLLLIYTYATLMPNDWRKTAAVVGVFAALPIGMMLVDAFLHDEVRHCLSVHDELSPLLMLIVIGAGGAVFSAQTICGLRHEAYEARQLGQYRLIRLLGSGGMGEVYEAEHQLLKRPCAVKLIRADKAGDARSLARFEREVQTTAKLSHWNTIEIFDYGRTAEGTFYYAMEYLPGLSIADLVNRHGPLPPERVVYLLEQVCDALHEAHALGLVHRDIKPANIFAAQRGGVFDVAKVLDFGLVKTAAREPLHLTQEGTITGSPLFMSPEQALGEDEPDARSDIYSLGAVAYFMLTGRPPFDAERPILVLMAHAKEPPAPPSQWRPEVPNDLEQVVLRCLAKRPDERFPDVQSLQAALAACQVSGRWTRADAAQWWQALRQPAAAVAV